MLATVLLAVVTLISLIIYLAIGQDTKKSPPGPFAWPIIGNHFLLKRLTDELGGQHKAFMELSKRYASDMITINTGREKVTVISGNKLSDLVLRSEAYDGRPWNEFIKLRNLGKKQGITMNDGTEWKELRGWMMRTMKLFGFGKHEMLDMIKNELTMLLNNLKNDSPQRLKLLITPAVINVLWFVAAGKSFCGGPKYISTRLPSDFFALRSTVFTYFVFVLNDRLNSLEQFVNLLERRSRAFNMIGGMLSIFPWIRYIAPEASGYNLLNTLNNELKEFLMETINEHKKRFKPGNESDLIDMFLNEMMNNEESRTIFTEGQLVVLLVDLFLAGCTTTSTSLEFLFLSMAVYQDVQCKVQKEIDSVIPSDKIPNLEDREKLPYVDAVISESQRLWPVFPIIGPRRVLYDTKLDKYTIPKDSTLLINMYSINKDPTIYPEPDKFKPERFIKNNIFEPDTNSLQFGKGRRRCPGEILAKSALFILFVGVMQKYTLLPVPGEGPNSVEFNHGITMSPKPHRLIVVPR